MDQNIIQKQYGLYINGKWQEASDKKTFESHSPADGRLLSTLSEASDEDVDLAVKSAWKAFEQWKHVDIKERAMILTKIADVIENNLDHLALIESLDNGKPIRETLSVDIPYAAEHFRYFAGVLLSEEGSSNMLNDNTLSLIMREPIGVVGQIVPWNFPFLMAAWKLAPVIAAGDCTIFKPSSSTSISVLELMRLIEGILPPGVINIITGKGSKSGNALQNHPNLSKLAFTGSTEVGYSIAASAAKKLIPATLELGGKSANIFFPDCNWELAMEGLQLGILFNQGQVCCAGSRVFVHEDIYDKFVEDAVKRFERVKVGMSWEKDVQMGPQISERELLQILEKVKKGVTEGAQIATGGYRLTENGLDKGAFMSPTLLINVTNDMKIAQEEIFGPVAVIIKFKSEEEVIKMANDNEYGLGGAVWTQDINRALRVARAVETGRMWVNTYNYIPAGAPFGGYKKSGIGRETHKMILDYYTQVKNIMINLSEKPLGLYK